MRLAVRGVPTLLSRLPYGVWGSLVTSYYYLLVYVVCIVLFAR